MKRETQHLRGRRKPYVRRHYETDSRGRISGPLEIARYVAHEMFAWPGGYALALILSDGAALCPSCIVENWREIRADVADDAGIPRIGAGGYTGWHPAGMMHEGETDETVSCDHCGREILNPPEGTGGGE